VYVCGASVGFRTGRYGSCAPPRRAVSAALGEGGRWEEGGPRTMTRCWWMRTKTSAHLCQRSARSRRSRGQSAAAFSNSPASVSCPRYRSPARPPAPPQPAPATRHPHVGCRPEAGPGLGQRGAAGETKVLEAVPFELARARLGHLQRLREPPPLHQPRHVVIPVCREGGGVSRL